MKVAVIILFLLAVSVYSVPEIYYLSPYMNSGVSTQISGHRNQFIIKSNHRRPASGELYTAFASDIYFGRIFMIDRSLSVTTKDEKNEVSISAVFIPLRFRFRHKFNVFENEKDGVFKNFAISPFYGISMTAYSTQISESYTQGHFGTAFGTRKKFARFSYFEIFTSPTISYTSYQLEGSERSNPIRQISPVPRSAPRFNVMFWDFAMPVGVGFKHRIFFFRNGLAFTHTLGGESRKVTNGTVTVNSYNFPKAPLFVEMGIHFRKFRELERRERVMPHRTLTNANNIEPFFLLDDENYLHARREN